MASKTGCAPQTLQGWVKQPGVDVRARQDVGTADAQCVKELERENRQLRRANEILKLASAFFAQAELDRRPNSRRASSTNNAILFGDDPICAVLQAAPSGCRRHSVLRREPHMRCVRAKRDELLMSKIERVWHASIEVYGADEVWRQLRREGTTVARCTVERLMRSLGLRGKVVLTTISDSEAPRPLDPSQPAAQGGSAQ